MRRRRNVAQALLPAGPALLPVGRA